MKDFAQREQQQTACKQNLTNQNLISPIDKQFCRLGRCEKFNFKREPCFQKFWVTSWLQR